MTRVQSRMAIARQKLPQLRLAGQPEFAGKTLSEWDADWMPVKGGFTVLHSDLRHYVGLFQARLGGTIMYIGKAVEVDNGGFRKRLSDFRRPSPSAREHYGAMRICDHLHDPDLQVLITGTDQRAVEIAELLRSAMIARHLPPWNMEKRQAVLATNAYSRVEQLKGKPTLKLISN